MMLALNNIRLFNAGVRKGGMDVEWDRDSAEG